MDLSSILLGLLQGATEFLPVSSSGHLILAESFFKIRQAGLAYDISLHMGTLLAILVYFRKDWLAMLGACLRLSSRASEDTENRRLLVLVIIATIPAAVAGVLLEDYAESTFRVPLLVACTLAGVGALMLYADRSGRRERGLKSLTMTDAVIIGVAQAFAVIPGVSRSGSTMTAGLFRGLDRPAAARFSFLMSAPIIAGAGLVNGLKLLHTGLAPGQASFFLTGFVASALSGYAFVAFLMRYLETRSLALFCWYRFALAAVVVWFLVL